MLYTIKKKSMKRKSRKIIFYASLLIFIIAGPLIVVYNYGYRVDFENKTISAVGGISIITRPKGTKLFINDNLYKEKGAYSLSPNFFVQNLIPKKYKFTVAKDGYWSWEKTFQIRPREITKAELIVLFEKNPLKEIFFENSGDIYQSDSERKIAFIEKIDDAKKNFVIIDLENPNESSFLRMEISYIENPVIISWNSSENKIIIFDTSNKKYFIANTAEKNIFPLPDNLFFNNEPLLLKNPRFNNVDNDNIFFADNGKLYKYNPGTKELDKLIDDVMSWSFINDTVFYIKNNGFLYKNNSLFTEETGYSSSQIPFFVKNQEYKIISSRTSFSGEQYIAVLELEKSKRFFMINNGGYFDFIDQGVKNIIFSWDLKKILLKKDHELEIF